MTDLSQRIAQLGPERLALLLRLRPSAGQPSAAAGIGVRPDVSQAPLSFLQRRLWFLSRLEGESPLYHMHAAFGVQGDLDLRALGGSLAEIARRHETLRARFEAADGEAVQCIESAAGVETPLADLRSIPEDRRQGEGERLIRAEACRPFDLSRAPLLRLLLVRLDEREHLLAVTFHHLICDGWSIGVFVREIGALYRALARDLPSPLAELPVQYADFAAWQRLASTDEVLAAQIAYWREALRGAPSLLELPADRPRPAVRSARGGTVEVGLPGSLVAALKRSASGGSATLYMVLLAAFQALLARLSGQDDILVGSPEAGRDQVETEGLIGPFVNTLVRRARFADDPGFGQLLVRVRDDVLAGAAHAGLPFDKLIEALQPERSASFTPLFQAWLVLHNTPQPTLELPGLTFCPIPSRAGLAKFDLTLEVAEENGEIRGALEHGLDLFDAATVERWRGHFTTLLERLARDGDAPLSALPLLSDAEIHHLRAEWRAAGSVPRSNAVELCGAFLQAPDALQGAKVAVRCGWEELTYEDLAGRSSQLARLLRCRGIGPETTVGLCVERSADMIVGLVGILKAGGVAVPLDPRLPGERLERMLADAGVGLLVTQQGLLFDLPTAAMACDLFCFDTDAGDLEAESREPLAEIPFADSLAYIIFTSGSTGEPKAVGVARGALAAHLDGVRSAFGLSGDDRVLQFAALSFDVAVEQILAPLAAGATLIVRGEEAWSPRELDRQIVEHEVTVVNLPTGFAQQWLDQTEGSTVASLRLAIAGGDAMAPGMVRRWLELPGPAHLLNAYGPTEGVITASVWDLPRHDPESFIPIGRALPERRLSILDGGGAPVPPGVAGELHLSGLLARGYLLQPGPTAASFIPDPFAEEPGARMYRSGDLAHRRPDGALVFLGRIDRQVKVRGFRIELGEIEEALRRHPALRDAIAVVQGSAADQKRIVAYVVPVDPAAPPGAEELGGALGQRLPQHMLPSLFVPLAELPLTENGKLDRRALPDPEAQPGQQATEHAAPRTPLEESMAAIWSEVLGLSAVGIHDDFFALGGHSLLGTLVISRILETFGVELPLQSLFANPTVASLAARLEAEAGQGGDPAPPIEPASREGSLPLSFAQQRLWFLEQLEPGTQVYVMPAALRLSGPLDVGALHGAVQEVVRRHEILRTTFTVVGDHPVQIIAPELAVPMRRVDLADLPLAEGEDRARDWAAAEARQPFDLEKGPLLRLRLLHMGADDHVLLLTLHHIVADGWSLGILLREVAELYPALARGERSSLPPLDLQYADFAVWQRRWLQGDELARQLGYWRRQLAGDLPRLELPFARPRPERQTHRGALHRFEIPPGLAGDLRELGQREGVTLFMTFMATFQILLYRLSGQEELAVAAGIANRTRREVEGLIGFFVNTLVLRASLAGNPSFREHVEQVRTTALGAYAHQDLPFERLVEELRPGRELAGSPLFQVMFQLQNAPMPRLQIGELTLAPLRLDTGISHFDLTLDLTETDERLLGAFEYDAELFDAASIADFAALFLALLREVTVAPDLPILDLPIGVPVPASSPTAALSLETSFAFEERE